MNINLDNTKLQLKLLLATEGAKDVLDALKKLLPSQSLKFNDLIKLEVRKNDVERRVLLGVLNENERQLENNRLAEAILQFIDMLVESDFDSSSAQSAFTTTKKPKRGNVLYHIPRNMELEKEHKCVVRIAVDKETIVKNIKITAETTIEDIRISDYMLVELIDPSDDHPFFIKAINEPIQFIDVDDYTEWLFWVSPQLPGKHVLLLKLAVIELVAGKERKRELVLEQEILITADKVTAEEISLQPAPISFALGVKEKEPVELPKMDFPEIVIPEAPLAPSPSAIRNPGKVLPNPSVEINIPAPKPQPARRSSSGWARNLVIAGLVIGIGASLLTRGLFRQSNLNNETSDINNPSAEPTSSNILTIAGKTWSKKNLDCKVSQSFPYGDNPANTSTYGRLYTWQAALTACSCLGKGWRLPTDKEWENLATANGGLYHTTTYEKLILGGDSGFNALLGGDRNLNGNSNNLGRFGYYWTSAENNETTATAYWFNSDDKTLQRNNFPKDLGGSVRCVKD